MARPRKQAGELFYDEFSNMSHEEQTVALRILQELHRQTEKFERRSGKAAKDGSSQQPEQQALTETAS